MGNDFDAVIDFLEDKGADESLVNLAKGSGLRKKLSEAEAEIERLRPFESQVAEIKKAPVRETAFKEHAKVDLTKLSKAQRALLNQFDWEGEAPSAEAVTNYASEWEFPTETDAGTEGGSAAEIAGQAHNQSGGIPSPEPIADQVAKLQAAGDWKGAMALKTQAALAAAEQA